MNKKKWRRRLALLALLLLLCAITAYGTLAYLTARTSVSNVITAGSVVIRLTQDASSPAEVLPGARLSKTVTVALDNDPATDKLSSDCWVRIRPADETWTGGGLTGGEDHTGMVTFTTEDPGWIEQDGWFYRSAPLTGSDASGTLNINITFAGAGMGNEYQGSTYSMTVIAQAVQYKNNEGGGSVLSAAGWPTTP